MCFYVLYNTLQQTESNNNDNKDHIASTLSEDNVQSNISNTLELNIDNIEDNTNDNNDNKIKTIIKNEINDEDKLMSYFCLGWYISKYLMKK